MHMSKSLSCWLVSGLAAVAVISCGDEPGSTAPSSIHRLLDQRLETADITFHFAEGDSVNAQYQQAFHDWAVPYLGISMPQRLRYYKYLDNNHMRDLTGQPYGSWADVERYAIHSVELQKGHEAIHVYSYVIGWPSDFFTEGIAVALDRNPFTGEEVPFFGAPVHTLCRNWLQAGSLYPLRDIVANEGFGSRRWRQTYPQAGSFTQFLIAEFGLETVKSLFRTIDDYDSTETILSAFESAVGMPLEDAESRWHAFLGGP
jgi:hypothetical protein